MSKMLMLQPFMSKMLMLLFPENLGLEKNQRLYLSLPASSA